MVPLTSKRPPISSHKARQIQSGIMRRSCHFNCLGTLERQRGRPADPKKVSVGSPTRPDRGKTVVTLIKKLVFSPFRAYLAARAGSSSIFLGFRGI